MSDQETAIQLIRNEAAELIVRAKVAGVEVRINPIAGVYVVSVLAPTGFRVTDQGGIEPLRKMITDTPLKSLLGPVDTMPKNNFLFCSSDRDALKPDLGNRRYFAIDLDVEPSTSGKGVHIFPAKELK